MLKNVSYQLIRYGETRPIVMGSVKGILQGNVGIFGMMLRKRSGVNMTRLWSTQAKEATKKTTTKRSNLLQNHEKLKFIGSSHHFGSRIFESPLLRARSMDSFSSCFIQSRCYSNKTVESDEGDKPVRKSGDHVDQSPDSSDPPVEPLRSARNPMKRKPHEYALTKEQLLERTTNFVQRLKIRFKWLLIKSARPFNTDDFSAFFSWIVMGNALLLFLGTTTFFSLVIFTFNTAFAQEQVAKFLGNVITKNSSLTVVFENAIVPSWSDGKISFRKCFVSKRPKNITKFIKGSQAEAAAAAATASVGDENSHEEEYDDGNYTQFDLTMEEVNVSLSFNKWVNGKGIVKDVEVKGMRGVVDRTHVHWLEGDVATNYKNIHRPGDFEIESFKMEDVLFTLMQPNGFRPFEVSVYNCELPQLRKHWLFYDFLNAYNMSGAYDNALFTIHKKQRVDDFSDNETNLESKLPWKRVTRLRVDSLNVDHLNTGLEGPFGWISSGKVDMIGDLMVPEEGEGMNVTELVSIIADSITKEANRYTKMFPNYNSPGNISKQSIKRDISKYLVLDLQVKLNNVRASVPLFTPELSYVNYALIRPIVAYINSKNTYIEIKCRVVKKLVDFEGSWTIYDCLLMDDISAEVYDAFVDYVADEEARVTRMRKVGFWSLQVFLQLLVITLGSVS